MSNVFSFLPERASNFAASVDALYFFLVALSSFFSLLIAGLLVLFAIRYRRRPADEGKEIMHAPAWLEVVWVLVPLGLVMVIFVWGAKVFFEMRTVPPGAMEIYVTGKQWMWKFQHPEGPREINELHVPVGQPVRLVMASEDVIHSLFVPAFRVKQDVLPGRTTDLWFEATRPGTYHLFCTEYCGTSHSQMIGRVVVLEPSDYEAWLGGAPAGVPMEVAGQKLFDELGCQSCHQEASVARGPALAGLFGRPVELANGRVVVADEAYVRESILNPRAKLVKGYEPLMPTFEGLVSEEQLQQLMAYVKSLQ